MMMAGRIFRYFLSIIFLKIWKTFISIFGSIFAIWSIFSITIDYHSLGMQVAFVVNKIITEKLVPNRIKISPPV